MIVGSTIAAKPKVLTVLHIIPTLEGGGAERQLSMLAVEQARRGHNVHLLVRRTGVHVQAIKDGGVQIHELGDIRSNNPGLFWKLVRKIAEIKPDVVQTWLPQMDILGGLGALACRAAWVVSERTAGEFYAGLPAISRLRLLLGQFASAIVANSNVGEQYWRRAAYRRPRLTMVRNALDFERIEKTAALRSRKPKSNPLLLVVGRFSREKALEVIVRALPGVVRQTRIRLLIIGEGSERAALEREIVAASVSMHVTILPYQPDWWRWLKDADGLISMSRFEGNPNVVLEAMAGRCPVILSDMPAHREIADASSALMVPLDDENALARAMAELVADKQAAVGRAEEAFRRVGSMTVTAMADAYEAIYRTVLDGKN